MIAGKEGQTAIVDTLVDGGADVNVQENVSPACMRVLCRKRGGGGGLSLPLANLDLYSGLIHRLFDMRYIAMHHVMSHATEVWGQRLHGFAAHHAEPRVFI